jgi:hypothetical protein
LFVIARSREGGDVAIQPLASGLLRHFVPRNDGTHGLEFASSLL